MDEIPQTGSLPARNAGCITFGCLNNFCKVNDRVLQLWARVLQAVPDSHLILLAPAGLARRRTANRFAQLGVATDRIEFVGHRSRKDYFELYHRIDLGLDTFPYNGHTTSLDSLWMGVPVITLAGTAAVGRAGISQLSNLGLTSLIAQNPRRVRPHRGRFNGRSRSPQRHSATVSATRCGILPLWMPGDSPRTWKRSTELCGPIGAENRRLRPD